MAMKIRKRGGGKADPEAPEAQNGAAVPDSDPVLEATLRGASWLEDNRNLVLAGVIAVIVAGVGVWIGSGYMDSQAVQASSTLSPALWDYDVITKDSPAMKQIEKSEVVDPPKHTYATDKARWEAIYKQAGDSLSKHKSGPLAQSARLTKAAAAMRLKKYDDATKLYEAYLSGKTDKAMLPFVYLGLATAYGAKGKVDKAVANYDKLVKQDDSYEGLAMYQKAQVYEAAGKKDKAKELYHEIIESHPKTPYRDDIERRLALL